MEESTFCFRFVIGSDWSVSDLWITPRARSSLTLWMEVLAIHRGPSLPHLILLPPPHSTLASRDRTGAQVRHWPFVTWFEQRIPWLFYWWYDCSLIRHAKIQTQPTSVEELMCISGMGLFIQTCKVIYLLEEHKTIYLWSTVRIILLHNEETDNACSYTTHIAQHTK